MSRRKCVGPESVTVLPGDPLSKKALSESGPIYVGRPPKTATTSRVKPPTDEQKKIANLYATVPMTQEDCAKLAERELRKPISQETVSRAVRAMNRWRKSQNLPTIPTRKKGRMTYVSPKTIEMDKRQGGEGGRAERQRERRSGDDPHE